MIPKLTFFNVGSGDMTLIHLADANATQILIDCNIRDAADHPDDDTLEEARAAK